MANAASGNVVYVDTSDTTIKTRRVRAIKYIGSASGTAIIKEGSSSGNTLWQEAGTNNLPVDEVCIKGVDNINITLTNSAKVIIYLK